MTTTNRPSVSDTAASDRGAFVELAHRFSETADCDYPDGFNLTRCLPEGFTFDCDNVTVKLDVTVSDTWECAVVPQEQVILGHTYTNADTPTDALADAIIAGILSGQTELVAEGRMSRVPWNFGGGPMSIRLRSPDHCVPQVRQVWPSRPRARRGV
ncbi:MAG: hypothetical protein WAW17_16910, partial [Rhodococcus sp. (in: high G+C Gram-positive bacteria)]|uniref:hypothetical protein n=1 Tax=Rhodococcus sp. TaxID=1831 RepID=UPI003BB1EB19